MSILSALKQQNSSLDDLAKLPQAAIMQMAQHNQIDESMLAPILARKAEMADAVARTNALQAPAQQPTVMEQLMAQNAAAENPAPAQPMGQPQGQPMAQAMPQDAGLGQLPIPERQYAGGGIVAFGGGGMADGEEDMDVNALNDIASNKNNAVFNSIMDDKRGRSVIDQLWSSLKNSYVGEKAARYAHPAEEKETSSAKRGSHPYEDMVIAEAKKQGVDPQLALHVLYKETGGLKNPESAKSKAGALGVMQLMPGTAKELGVNPNVPEENVHGGIKYLAKLGKMFDNDPRLVAAAYNAGPGNVRKHGGVPNFSETRNYIKGLAEGGVVGYAPGGMIDPASTLSAGESIVPDNYVPKTPEEIDYFKQIMARNALAREDLKQSAIDDRNMALLQAGLGIMGGTSPNALTNIGTGAMQGAQAYGASKRARAAQQAALDTSEINAVLANTKQGELKEWRDRRLEEGKRASIEKSDNAKAKLALDQEDKTRRAGITAQARAGQNPAYKNAAKALEGLDPSDPMYQYNVNIMQEIENAYMTGRGINIPKPPTKVEEPGFFERVFGGGKSAPTATAPARYTFDALGNPT